MSLSQLHIHQLITTYNLINDNQRELRYKCPAWLVSEYWIQYLPKSSWKAHPPNQTRRSHPTFPIQKTTEQAITWPAWPFPPSLSPPHPATPSTSRISRAEPFSSATLEPQPPTRQSPTTGTQFPAREAVHHKHVRSVMPFKTLLMSSASVRFLARVRKIRRISRNWRRERICLFICWVMRGWSWWKVFNCRRLSIRDRYWWRGWVWWLKMGGFGRSFIRFSLRMRVRMKWGSGWRVSRGWGRIYNLSNGWWVW